jgi:hypothetical protein
MEAAEIACRDMANTWFGKKKAKHPKIIYRLAIAYCSTCNLFYEVEYFPSGYLYIS